MNDAVLEIEKVTPMHVIPVGQNISVAPRSDSQIMMRLIEAAMEKDDFDIPKLERLLEVKARLDAAEAQKSYDQAFASFKAEAITVIKNKTHADGPMAGKSFAELHAVISAATPALSKYGLSSSWKITRDEKEWIEVTCYLRHFDGHQETVSMGGEPDRTGSKNAIHARVSTVSYLERHTLKAILGIAEKDDDNNGANGAETKKEPTKALPPISVKSFNNAMARMRKGEFNGSNMRSWHSLSPAQEKELVETENELKKETV